LAHARRWDQVVNLAQRVIEVALFFHPAVHWLSRSLRRERELCADALAVRLTGDPLALAEALQAVARLRLDPPRIAAVGASLGGPSVSLLPRVQELIGMTPSRPRFALWPLAALPAAGLFAVLAAAAGLADDRPSAPVTPPRFAVAHVPRSAVKDARDMTRKIDPRLAPFEVKGDPSFDPRRGRMAVDGDRQICFEARYITTILGSWREPLGDRLKLIKRDGEVAAWTLDDRTLRELLDQAQRDERANVLRAPKVTTFYKVRATILNKYNVYHVADVEKVEAAGRPGIRPIIKPLDLGSQLDMTGTMLPHATRLAVNLSDSWLTAMDIKERKETIGTTIQTVQYQAPTVVERRCQLTTDIPPGTHLLISLGPAVSNPKVTGLPGAINDLFHAVGLPEPIKFTPCERLVLITPHPIILESEERVSSPPPSRLKAN
jgi:hypothetical protein